MVDTRVISAARSVVPAEPWNLGLAFAVAAGAMTISLKQSDGAADPDTAAPVLLTMPSASVIGGSNSRRVEAPASLTIPSGATLGRTSAVPGHMYVYAIEDGAGGIELAVSAKCLGRTGITSTTAISTGADAGNVIYSQSARTNTPYRLLARAMETQTTAGVWAALPTRCDLSPPGPFETRFLASLGSNQSVGNNTATKLSLGTVEFDVGGFFDATNYRWRPPAGAYLVTGAARLATGVDQQPFWLTLYKNGSAFRELCISQMSGNGDLSLNGTVLVEADGDDYYELFVQHLAGAARDIYGSAQYTFFCGVQAPTAG